jgi:cobalt-zinc-cadmium efflux system outer membrane protein
LTQSEVRRDAALGFVRLLAAQEQLESRRAALAEVERIRSLVAGRMQSGMASRYDVARADVELSLATLAAQRAETDVNEQSAALAGLAAASNWRPRASGSLHSLHAAWPEAPPFEAVLASNPASRVAHDDTALAQARIEVAHRERFPVPSVSVGRTWTSGPFGAANFIGLSSEIPILDDRRALEDKARADAAVARERERAANATLRAEYERQRESLRLREAALARFEKSVSAQQAEFREMAESAYRLGRGSLFELLDARRSQAEAASARLELLAAILESQVELRALAGEL